MQLIDTRLQPGGVGANTGQAVTTGDPCTGHAPKLRPPGAVLSLASPAVMSALCTLKGDVLLHYTTIWPSH